MTKSTRRPSLPSAVHRRRALAALALPALVLAFGPDAARGQAARVIARVDLEPEDNQVDLVPDKAGARFAAIALVARKRAVDVRHVAVVFGNGRRFDVPLRTVLAPGEASRRLDLPGEDRTIRRVFVRYAVAPGGGAELALLGWPA